MSYPHLILDRPREYIFEFKIQYYNIKYLFMCLDHE